MNLHSFTLSIALLASASASVLAQEAPPRPGAARTPSEEIKLLPPEEVAKLKPKQQTTAQAPQEEGAKRLPQPDNPLDPNRPAKSNREPAKIKPAENAVIPAENEKKVLSKAERKAKQEAKDKEKAKDSKDKPAKGAVAVKDAKDAKDAKAAKDSKAAKEPAKIKPAENAAVPAENQAKPAAKDKQASMPPARRAVPMVVDGMPSTRPSVSYGPTLTQPGVSTAVPTSAITPARPAVPNRPVVVNSCDSGGCFDTNGVRYNGSAGSAMVGPGGKLCHNNGVTMQC